MAHDLPHKTFRKTPQFNSLKLDPNLCNDPNTANDTKLEKQYKKILCPTRYKGEKGL